MLSWKFILTFPAHQPTYHNISILQVADHQKQAELVTEYIASKKEKKVQYLNTNHSLRLGIAGPPGID